MNGIILTLAAALTMGINALALGAQTAPTTPASPPETVRTFYLNNVSQQNDADQVVTALRNLLDPKDRMMLVPFQNAIVIKGTPDQLAMAQKVLNDLDRPRKIYHLTYTVREMEDNKQTGIQHYAIIVVSGTQTSLKNDSRVPVTTGPPITHGSTPQYQLFTIGLNIDAQLDESVSGVRVRSIIDRTGIVEDKSGSSPMPPAIREATLKGTSIMTPGKSVTLGSIDIPGSTRHLDIEVALAVVP